MKSIVGKTQFVSRIVSSGTIVTDIEETMARSKKLVFGVGHYKLNGRFTKIETRDK